MFRVASHGLKVRCYGSWYSRRCIMPPTVVNVRGLVGGRRAVVKETIVSDPHRLRSAWIRLAGSLLAVLGTGGAMLMTQFSEYLDRDTRLYKEHEERRKETERSINKAKSVEDFRKIWRDDVYSGPYSRLCEAMGNAKLPADRYEFAKQWALRMRNQKPTDLDINMDRKVCLELLYQMHKKLSEEDIKGSDKVHLMVSEIFKQQYNLMTPTAENLRDAILANAEGLVASYLDAGADPNQCAQWPTLEDVKDDDDDIDKEAYIAKRYSFPDQKSGITSLHVAVVNIYQNHEREKPWNLSSINILEKLLKYGAKADGKMSPNCILCHILCHLDRLKWLSVPRKFTPIDLAVFLKSYKRYLDDDLCPALDYAIERITRALADTTQKVPRVSVAKSVVDMLQTMVLSEEFSDVRFECKDGDILPAHKAVLSSASTYFRNYFTGPWGNRAEHQSGIWKTSLSSDVVRAILMFIYTGEIPSSLLKSQTPTLLAASSEYDLPELIQLSEVGCIRTMDDDNVKDILVLANLHGSKKLKEACFAFMRKNPQVLTTPEMISLAGEDAILWEELRAEVTPPSERRKTSK